MKALAFFGGRARPGARRARHTGRRRLANESRRAEKGRPEQEPDEPKPHFILAVNGLSAPLPIVRCPD